jgi:hypothetical protein
VFGIFFLPPVYVTPTFGATTMSGVRESNDGLLKIS